MAKRPQADLIAAIATAPGRGGIGVIRLSGPDLGPLALQVIGRPPEPRTAMLARFLDGNGEEIDEGIALFSRPRVHIRGRM